MSPGRLLSRLKMSMPAATEPESSSAMMVSVSNSVFSFSQRMAAAIKRLTTISGQVGFDNPSQKPIPTPASAACETVSLKKAMRRAVTKTPSNAQSGARNSAASKARCMNGSVSMVVVVRRSVNPVRLFERLGVHDLLGRALAANHSVQRVYPRGMAIDHREVVRNEDNRQAMAGLDLRNQIIERLLPRRIDAGGR